MIIKAMIVTVDTMIIIFRIWCVLYLSSIEIETVKMIITTAAAT